MAERQEPNLLDAIEELRAQDPFVPFAIIVSSGDRYVIEAPQNLVRMQTELFYAFPRSDKFVLIRINQLVAVERAEDKRRSGRKAS
jgi:hypothetical protein